MQVQSSVLKRGLNFATKAATNSPMEIDLLPWCSSDTFNALMSTLGIWRIAKTAIVPTLRPNTSLKAMRLTDDCIRAQSGVSIVPFDSGDGVGKKELDHFTLLSQMISQVWADSHQYVSNMLLVYGKLMCRQVVCSVCFPRGSTHRKLMMTATGHLIDWRWQYMESRFRDINLRLSET